MVGGGQICRNKQFGKWLQSWTLWHLTLTTEFFESTLTSFMKLLGNFFSFPNWGDSYVLDTYFVSYGQNTKACTGCLASVDGPV